MTNIKQILTAFLATAFLGVQADIILAQWDFNTTDQANASFVASDVTASAFSHAGGTFSAGGHSTASGINLDGSSYVDGEPIHNSNNAWTGDSGRYFARAFEDVSITPDTKHFAFSITLNPGVQYQLTNVWFDFGLRSNGGDVISVQMSPNADFSDPIVLGAGQATGLEATSLGYQDDEGTVSLGINQPSNQQWSSWTRLENTLNTPVPISGTTYFRIYSANGTNSSNARDGVMVDNVTITAIPEPGTLTLLIVGGLFVYIRRRRK